eukprot:gnl/TRDRNA2_/TRDRNA2_84008_c0_seq2.p1 gnl/TRDRNA2_/TRDRNA2_84008_c0~~gnl/TRDRNA2_/TRDRNA2_84008_c0_seq2.p1  ORF type:complete len:280 (-),score=42.20 gnl/TRDRNA2_/TRDRNA2_84008_c0_seq2:214-999(-)
MAESVCETSSAAMAERSESAAPTEVEVAQPSSTEAHEQRSPIDDHDYAVGEDDADGRKYFVGEWDEEGVYFYQAFNDGIADWALAHQHFGGPLYGTSRMTWIKPSFGWVLYRSGYGHKHNQNRILKIKLPHAAVAELLSKCQCKDGGGGSKGRVQWDPGRDLMSGDGKVPRMMRCRAIQIGLAGSLSELYVRSVISIQEVTELAHKVGVAHKAKTKDAMSALLPELPAERPYLPRCPESVLVKLEMLPGKQVQKRVYKSKH